jgi:hypothetical protein
MAEEEGYGLPVTFATKVLKNRPPDAINRFSKATNES